MTSDRRHAPNPRLRRRALIRASIAAAVIVAGIITVIQLGLLEPSSIRRTAATMRALSTRPWFVPAFIGTYAALVTVGLPASPVLLVGGAVFGVFPGALYNWMGSTLGAMGGYATGRLIGGSVISALFARKLTWIDRLRGEHGFLPLLRLRLTMVLPYSLLNIASGMVRLPFKRYVLAAAIGVLPSTTLYTAFAERLLSGAEGVDRNAFWHAAGIAVVALGLSFVPRFLVRQRTPE